MLKKIQLKFYTEICSNRMIIAAAENIDLEPTTCEYTSAGEFEFGRTST